jgi:hypothetical protein
LDAFVEGHCLLCAVLTELGEDGETLLKDTVNGWARLECARVEPSLLDLFMEELDMTVAWEDIVRILRREGLVATSMNELEG